jgi:hypothetical protein
VERKMMREWGAANKKNDGARSGKQ